MTTIPYSPHTAEFAQGTYRGRLPESPRHAQEHAPVSALLTEHAPEQPQPSRPALGRRATITREELIDAALKLLGPHRSVSTLSLREIAREAGIAPNSFYRHFRDVDELAIALIERAGTTLRKIIGAARQQAFSGRSIVRNSMTVFLEQLNNDQHYLQLLLREGKVGSPAFRNAVERQYVFFEEELRDDLIRIEQSFGYTVFEPATTAKAITRMVIGMAASAAESNAEVQRVLLDQSVVMIKMILLGARTLQERQEKTASQQS